jgi:hypothetical protein
MAGRGVRNTLIKPARFARYALYGRALPISKTNVCDAVHQKS